MSQEMKSRMLTAAAAGLMLAGAAALPLQASAQETAPVQSSDQMTVVRDAETGKLRHASDAENAQLKLATVRNTLRAAPAQTQQKWHRSGARGARLTDEHMSASVAFLKADGTVAEQCFDSKEQADAAVKNAVAPATKYETE